MERKQVMKRLGDILSGVGLARIYCPDPSHYRKKVCVSIWDKIHLFLRQINNGFM